MTERQRIFLLTAIMVVVCVIAVTTTILLLYRTEIEQSRARLRETAESQARLIEAIARFDTRWSKDYPEGATAATLSQVFDAHEHYEGFGETGEFTLGRREGNLIVFLLRHRHGTVEHPEPIPIDSQLAEPMRRALNELSGSVIGPDYRGETVLAGYEPVQELGLGIVAKIDLAEIRAPFVKSGLIAATLTFFIVILAMGVFRKVSNPVIAQLEAHSNNLEREIEERKKVEESLRSSEVTLRKSREKIQYLADKLLTTQEEERRILSRELHDDINQRVAMLAVDIGMLKQQLSEPEDLISDQLGQFQARAMELANDVRRISRELHPSVLEHLGLGAALKSHCAELSEGIGLQVKLTLRKLPEAIPSDVALCLYRVAQECLHNVARHSGAREARVVLRGTTSGLKLSISDAGVGFDMEKAYKKGTLGLISMEERVRLANGNFSVKSIPGNGTKLEVLVPLSKEGP
jgi:signal transduction histidine kinase